MARLKVDVHGYLLCKASEFEHRFIYELTHHPDIGVTGLAEVLDITEDDVMLTMVSLMKREIITVHWPDWILRKFN